jgi:hypothetical protein
MSGPLASAIASLDAAVARRRAVERSADERWRDAARRTVDRRLLQPLDEEASAVRASLVELDTELRRALALLAD